MTQGVGVRVSPPVLIKASWKQEAFFIEHSLMKLEMEGRREVHAERSRSKSLRLYKGKSRLFISRLFYFGQTK